MPLPPEDPQDETSMPPDLETTSTTATASPPRHILLNLWRKQPEDSYWHPIPPLYSGKPRDAAHYIISPRIDELSAIVDSAPFICGAGALAHLRQLPQMGFTASANVLRNPRTLAAMSRWSVRAPLGIMLLQYLGVDYRSLMPRWAHERERRRDEEDVRKHAEVGAVVGLAVMANRILFVGLPRAYPRFAPVEVVLGAALADLAHREWCKTHGAGPLM